MNQIISILYPRELEFEDSSSQSIILQVRGSPEPIEQGLDDSLEDLYRALEGPSRSLQERLQASEAKVVELQAQVEALTELINQWQLAMREKDEEISRLRDR